METFNQIDSETPKQSDFSNVTLKYCPKVTTKLQTSDYSNVTLNNCSNVTLTSQTSDSLNITLKNCSNVTTKSDSPNITNGNCFKSELPIQSDNPNLAPACRSNVSLESDSTYLKLVNCSGSAQTCQPIMNSKSGPTNLTTENCSTDALQVNDKNNKIDKINDTGAIPKLAKISQKLVENSPTRILSNKSDRLIGIDAEKHEKKVISSQSPLMREKDQS